MENINRTNLQPSLEQPLLQSEFQTTMTALHNDPEQFLGEHCLKDTPLLPHQEDTFFLDVRLTQQEDGIRLTEITGQETREGTILYTAMRETNSPRRFDEPTIVELGNGRITTHRGEISQSREQTQALWLTAQQSGCTVLVAKHGRAENGNCQVSPVCIRV